MQFAAPKSTGSKVDVPMAPMIDIVFQLLIFFMLNLKIMAPEGDLSVHLPSGDLPRSGIDMPIQVGLRSDADGQLTQLTLGNRNLGNDDGAFDRLNESILQIIGRPGNPATRDLEVILDADFETQHKYVVKAISRCTGRVDPATKQVVRYVEKIRFAPPHAPKA